MFEDVLCLKEQTEKIQNDEKLILIINSIIFID